ncbi:MAG: TrmH family RNA methyltransferase, partial [Longimicrobiales bacterium]
MTSIGAERIAPEGREDDGAEGEGDDAAAALPPATVEALARIVIVLDHPKDLVNIASVTRVMMNFGLTRLRLVNPDEFDTWRIGGIAHKSQRITEVATLHESLDEALADASFVVGTSARARTAGRTYGRPRDAATSIAAHAAEETVA